MTAIHAHGAVDTTTKLNSFGELFRALDDESDVSRPSPYLQLQPFYPKMSRYGWLRPKRFSLSTALAVIFRSAKQ